MSCMWWLTEPVHSYVDGAGGLVKQIDKLIGLWQADGVDEDVADPVVVQQIKGIAFVVGEMADLAVEGELRTDHGLVNRMVFDDDPSLWCKVFYGLHPTA